MSQDKKDTKDSSKDKSEDKVVTTTAPYPSSDDMKKHGHNVSVQNVKAQEQALRNTFGIATNTENILALHNRLKIMEDNVKVNAENISKIAKLEQELIVAKSPWYVKLFMRFYGVGKNENKKESEN